MPKRFSKSVRKYVRREKARLRQEFLDYTTRKKLFQELYKKFLPEEKNKF